MTAALFGAERLATYSLAWADIDANLLGWHRAGRFAAAIEENHEPEVTGEQGLRSLAAVFGFLQIGVGRASGQRRRHVERRQRRLRSAVGRAR